MTDNNNLHVFLEQMSQFSDEPDAGTNGEAPMAIPATISRWSVRVR